MSYTNPIEIYTKGELQALIDSGIVNNSITINGEYITSLEIIVEIHGSLTLKNTLVESLGELKVIKGDLTISTYNLESNLKSLNELEEVEGDLWLRYSNIEDLGNLKKVDGNLNLRDTPVQNLGNLNYVAGNLYLPKRLQDQIDLSKIKVGGKIKYWNDAKSNITPASKTNLNLTPYNGCVPQWKHRYIFSHLDIKAASASQQKFYTHFKDQFLQNQFIDIKGNNNYVFVLYYDIIEQFNKEHDFNKLVSLFDNLSVHYPVIQSYTDCFIKDYNIKQGNIEEAWKTTYNQDYIGYETVMFFESKLSRKLLDGNLLIKICGTTHLTPFGVENIEQISAFANHQISEFEKEQQKDFFAVFFKNNKLEPYSSHTAANQVAEKSQLNYDYEYYSKFFIDRETYKRYLSIDIEQAGKNYAPKIPHVVDKAVIQQGRQLLREAENAYRESIGLPRIGEGWIAETELFYRLSEEFEQFEVVHHASPSWLGRQHLDIYFPGLNIAIEYQGAQHYEPIDFFGGEQALKATQERDLRKKLKCEDNNCYLLYVEKGYDFQEVKMQITQFIKTVHNKK